MTLREAVANLIKVKGRHNTEIAYQKLVEAFDADEPVVKWDASAPLVVHPHPAFQTTPPQQHSEQWWQHEVSNAYAEGYEKGRVFCGCGDQIMPDDGAECGTCVTARNAVKEWVGLTDEQKEMAYALYGTMTAEGFVKSLETKLREKNT